MSGKEEIMAIFRKARAFWEARVLMTAAELDIFSVLQDKPKTAKQVAKELSSNVRGTEFLLNAVAAMGMLEKKNNAFRVKKGMERALSSSSPDTVLPIVQHMAHLWEAWGQLTRIVQKGKAAETAGAHKWDERSTKAFIGAMHAIGQGMAKSVMTRLDFSPRTNLIDIGGGSGVYTIAALKAAPHMRATLFDLPPVIEIARKKLTEERLLDRVTLVRGDYQKDALPGGHDVALLSAIIHSNSPAQNVALFRKAFKSLVPGGSIVVRDYVMSDDHTRPPDGAFFAINMLVNTKGGGTYSLKEIKRGLEAAGFRKVKLLHHAEMDSLVTAERPKK